MCATVTAVEDYFLTRFELVAGRLVVSASQGVNTSDQDVDNITVAMTPAAAAMPPLLFGDTVSGSVGRAGAVNRYAFTITEPTAVVFDALTNNSQLRWQISGPSQTGAARAFRSEEHTSELQSLMRISYAVFCLKTKKHTKLL